MWHPALYKSLEQWPTENRLTSLSQKYTISSYSAWTEENPIPTELWVYILQTVRLRLIKTPTILSLDTHMIFTLHNYYITLRPTYKLHVLKTQTGTHFGQLRETFLVVYIQTCSLLNNISYVWASLFIKSNINILKSCLPSSPIYHIQTKQKLFP